LTAGGAGAAALWAHRILSSPSDPHIQARMAQSTTHDMTHTDQPRIYEQENVINMPPLPG
jgi:hypothetical protein